MDIVEKLRLVDCTFWYKPLGHGIDTDLDVPAYELGALSHEAADEIESLYAEVDMAEVRIHLLRGWLRHIGYYVSRSEPNLSPTEKYIQEICAEALNLELEDVRKEPYSGGISK